jgi:O-antigen/teichoic acid export membrane protein
MPGGTPPPPGEHGGSRGNARLRPALIWSFITTTGGSLIGALLQLGLVALLDPTSFGVMVLALIWVTLAIMLLTHGPTLAVIQQDNITDDHINTAFWVNLAISIGYAGVVAATAPLWAVYNHTPALPAVQWALIPSILLTGVVAVPDAVMRRRMMMRAVAVRTINGTIIGGLLGLACAFLHMGVWALVVQQLAMAVACTVLLWVAMPWRPTRPRWDRIRATWPDLRKTSLHSFGGALGNFVSMRVDGLIMGHYFVDAVVGLYRFDSRFAELAVDGTSRGLERVALPELAKYKQDPKILAERLGRLVHLGIVLALPALAILSAASQPLIDALGPKWVGGAPIMPWLCGMSAVGVVVNLLVPALQAADRPDIPAIFVWVSAILYTAAFVVTAILTGGDQPLHRLMIVVAVMLTVRLAVLVAMCFVMYGRVLRVSIRPTLRQSLPALVASAITVAAGWLTDSYVALGAAPVVRLLIVGTVATAVAGATMLTVDPVVRGWSTPLTRRLRGAH